MSKQIPFSEVKKHNTKEDLWIVIHGGVYDVTKFQEEHPGGPDPLIDSAGKDGTTAFEDVGHSSDAREMMAKYKIGEVINDKSCKCCDKCKEYLPYALAAVGAGLLIGFGVRQILKR